MPSIITHPVLKLPSSRPAAQPDQLAVEEPLEIKLVHGPSGRRRRDSLAVTMRTPGHDFDLALGFLFTEGIIGSKEEVRDYRFAGEALHPASRENVVLVDLDPAVRLDLDGLSRHFYTSSSCGVCGKASLDMVRTTCVYLLQPGYPRVPADRLFALPEKMEAAQGLFVQTGGVHAAALFRTDGSLVLMREDVGRHNALDKLIGAALQSGLVPLSDFLLLVSGRASFELVQKALMAGAPLLAAVGAVSSLAVELADDHGMTLLGFLRNRQANVYCGPDRIEKAAYPPN